MRDPMECPVCYGPKFPSQKACSKECFDRLVIDYENHTYTVLPKEARP